MFADLLLNFVFYMNLLLKEKQIYKYIYDLNLFLTHNSNRSCNIYSKIMINAYQTQ